MIREGELETKQEKIDIIYRLKDVSFIFYIIFAN